jgi:APA family basic amino acid/polyamine antiporter
VDGGWIADRPVRCDTVPDVRPADAEPGRLDRRLGVRDAVVVGLGAMIGAGVFSAFAPAARAAGAGLLVGLALAAGVAYCNATSSARLAARYPESGGTYVYAGRRLGPAWGVLAGWAFVLGKTASCAAMGLTFAAYAAPDHLRVAAVGAVVAVTAVDVLGVEKSALVTRVVVGFVLVVLTVLVVAGLGGGDATAGHLRGIGDAGLLGILEAGGLLFFAFAGYARIATLGEEVRDPERTIPRAIPLALGVALAGYAAVGVTALLVVGPDGLAATDRPLHAVARASGVPGLGAVVTVGAAVASLGSLLSLLLGVTRTTFAMARDHRLPHALAAVHPRRRTPHRATLVVGACVAVLVATLDLRAALGFSSFAVLLYYALANASALTLTDAERRPPRALPVLGIAGCLLLGGSALLGDLG